MEKPFSYPIYQQAKRYFQQNKIRDFKVNNNIIEGTVLDGNAYHVKLVFNVSKQLTSKKCDCSYSKFYHECKHMAALYMKVHEEKALDLAPMKLRDIYDKYVGSVARPLAKNYSDFEYKLKLELYKYRVNGQLDNIKSYCNEFSNLNYPSSRKDVVIMYFQDIFNEFFKKDELKNHLYEWIYQCLVDDKNDFLHDYFLRIIQSREDKVEVIHQLLNNEKVQLNSILVNKLLMIAYEYHQLDFDEFKSKYSIYMDSEAMLYLRAKEAFFKQNHTEVIDLYKEFMNRYPFSSLKRPMSNLYDKSIFGNDPKQYIQKYLSKINYWTKDFDELTAIKKVLGPDWFDIREEVYDGIKKRVYDNTFEKLLVDENEWEVALKYIYEEPTYSNIRAYLGLVISNDVSLGYSVFFEFLVSVASKVKFESDAKYVVELLEYFYRKYGNKDVLDHMIYHLRHLFEYSNLLINALDEMEDGHEN